MKFSRIEENPCNSSIWKDIIKQETNSYFHSISEGLKDQKFQEQDLKSLAHPKLNTIRTNSYMNIDQFYSEGILKSPVLVKNQSTKRYVNYPWSKPTFSIGHDTSIKNIKSQKFIRNQLIQRKEVVRQSQACKNLKSGFSSERMIGKKLPPLVKSSKLS